MKYNKISDRELYDGVVRQINDLRIDMARIDGQLAALNRIRVDLYEQMMAEKQEQEAKDISRRILQEIDYFNRKDRRTPMDNRHINEDYAQIAAELIASEESLAHIANSAATIIYLSSDYKKTSKDKLVFGQCEKIQDKYKWGIPADFTITIFEPNVEEFTDDQIRMLLHHELLHVGIEFKPDGTEDYSIIPHDLEDFKEIINKYGTDWAEI